MLGLESSETVLIEFSVMIQRFCIYTVQYGSQEPRLVQYGIEVLISLDVSSHWPLVESLVGALSIGILPCDFSIRLAHHMVTGFQGECLDRRSQGTSH